ncbi:hypothetical protein CXF95_18010 [Paraglaciecola sp. MB-3u-78]|nr:hypothetical protein CXF95_18010 [Paraglaciecola sp. MB-3u-78]
MPTVFNEAEHAGILIRYAYVILAFFQTNPFVQLTFLLQPKKVSKKGRSLLKFLTAQKDLF